MFASFFSRKHLLDEYKEKMASARYHGLRLWNLLSLLLILVMSTRPASASFFYPVCEYEDCPPCPICTPPSSIRERLLQLFDYFTTTTEVLVRGFSLGFGAQMLKFLLVNNDNDEHLSKLGERIRISVVTGLAMACFIHGSSVFVPTQLRLRWFAY